MVPILDQTCIEGQWVDSETCDDPDICTNDAIQSGTTVCGLNGAGFLDQICTEGQWVIAILAMILIYVQMISINQWNNRLWVEWFGIFGSNLHGRSMD